MPCEVCSAFAFRVSTLIKGEGRREGGNVTMLKQQVTKKRPPRNMYDSRKSLFPIGRCGRLFRFPFRHSDNTAEEPERAEAAEKRVWYTVCVT